MINVYDENNEIIARVRYNNDLDYWDGQNHTNGGDFMHKGITKLRKLDKYVIIIGSGWQGQLDKAYVVSDKEALHEILVAGCDELLEQGRFKRLRDLCHASLDTEEEVEV